MEYIPASFISLELRYELGIVSSGEKTSEFHKIRTRIDYHC